MLTLSLFALVVGFLVWLICSRPREKKSWIESLLAEAGKLSFFAGLLAYLLNAGTRVFL